MIVPVRVIAISSCVPSGNAGPSTSKRSPFMNDVLEPIVTVPTLAPRPNVIEPNDTLFFCKSKICSAVETILQYASEATPDVNVKSCVVT